MLIEKVIVKSMPSVHVDEEMFTIRFVQVKETKGSWSEYVCQRHSGTL